MSRTALLLTAAALALVAAPQVTLAAAPQVGVIQNFGPNLLADCPNPEGIAIDPTGNLYAASFPAFQAVRSTPSANICVISPAGVLIDKIAVPPGPAGVTNLLGELFEPGQGLYVVDFANGIAGFGRLLRVDPATHRITTLVTRFAAANAIAQDRHRNLFVSDSFEGNIVRVAPDGSSSSVWVSSSLLVPQGFPPFGANGLAFDRDQKNMYVANTSNDTIVRIPVLDDGSAGTPVVFAAGSDATGALDGADGIMFDAHGNLFVCANQANEIQVLAPDGTLVARYKGLGANALDFPASLVFKGRDLYITNLSLFDGGVQSKVSVMVAPNPGLPLRP
jgi:sugar lactone lactonase YvrE